MAVPALRTWVPGDLATSTLLNAQIRDVVKYQMGTLATGKPLGCFNKTATQSISNDTWETVTWNQNIKAPTEGTSFHSIVSSTDLVTIQTAGLYDVRVQTYWAADADGRRATRIQKNSATIVHAGVNSAGCTPDGDAWTGNSSQTAYDLSMMTVLAATDVLRVQVWHTAGAALNLQAASWFSVRWVAAS